MNLPELPLIVYIVIFTFLGSMGSFIGGFFLLGNKELTKRISHFLVSFAAGVLLGVAFLDLMPEAVGHRLNLASMLIFTLVGFMVFFVLERFIHWSHNHPFDEKDERRTVELIVLSGSFHKAIDGAVIAATFLVNIPLGIVTSLAIATHEVPRELGDFAVMLERGLKPKRILSLSLLSALSALGGALVMFVFSSFLEAYLSILLSITAGFFLYISASALIPEIHEKSRGSLALFETLFIIFGISVVYFLVRILEH